MSNALRVMGDPVGLAAVGTDTDIDVTITPKGSGDVVVQADVDATGGYRILLDGWYQNNVAASQTGVALSRLSGPDCEAGGVIVPRAGSITAVAVYSNAARTAGTCTVEVVKNGAATGFTAALNGTNTQFAVATAAKDARALAAGDILGVQVTTSSDWAPTTADIRVVIEIEQ